VDAFDWLSHTYVPLFYWMAIKNEPIESREIQKDGKPLWRWARIELLRLSLFIFLSGLLWNQSMTPSIQQLVVNSSRHINHFTENLDEDAQAILTQFYTLLSNSNLGVCRRHKHYDLEPNEVIMLTKNVSGGEVLYET
jgi:hypothetical protein